MTELAGKPRSRAVRAPAQVLVALILAALCLASVAASGSAATAQGSPPPASSDAATETGKPVALPERLSRAEARDLLSRLSDDQVRQLLLQQLDRLAEEEAAAADTGETFADSFETQLHGLRGRLALMLSAVGDLPSLPTLVLDRITEGKDWPHVWTLLLFTAIIFAGGAAGEWLFRRMFSRFARHPTGEGPETALGKIWLLTWRAVVDVLGIVVFGLCATGLFFVFYQGHAPTRLAISTLFWMVVFVRLVSVFARMALAPRAASLRLPPIDTETARRIYRRIMVLTGTTIVAVLFMDFLAALDISEGLSLLVGRIVSAAVAAAVIAVIWHDRREISRLIRSQGADGEANTGRIKQLLAGNWHVLATCYVVGIWVFSSVTKLATGEDTSRPAIISLFILLAIPLADGLMRAVLSRVLRAAPVAAQTAPEGGAAPETTPAAAGFGPQRSDVPGDAKTPVETGRAEYYRVLLRNLRIVLAIVGVVVLASVWEVDVRGMASRGVGETLAGALFDIVIAVVLASAGWGIIKTAINQRIREEGGEVDKAADMEGEGGGKGGTRLQTLLPLFRKFLFVTLVVIVTLMILSELGVNIGPLIAGAGVVGIAIGFGAQTLVKDIVSGLFFLVDDAFRVGEYIDVGPVRGTVEGISIRSLRLRHQNGPLHTVPFGDIQRLTNFSRDWAIMKLELRLPTDTDVEKVRKLVKKVGQDMMDHPDYGKDFMQPLKSQGVNRMDDDAFIVRVKFMTKPGQQFILRREVFRRIQEAFTANGIHFAPRRVIVDTGAASPEVAAAAAAAAATPSASKPGGGKEQPM